jgi:formamidopyrimidine-DNA glycosylase
MPELPEVEVIKIFLEDKLLGQTISSLEILNPKSFIGDIKDVIGQKIVKFTRLGKQLSIYLSNGKILLVHLKMTGQLILSPLSSKGVPEGQGILMGHPTKINSMPNKSTRLIFKFKNYILFFNDQRKFGWVKVMTQPELVEGQKNLGLDILDQKFTNKYFYQALQRTRAPIKSVLLNQHFFAGIGNIYANDALFLSHIHPITSANKIQRSRALALQRSIISIMNQSILAGGSTMKDNKYVRPDGSFGANQFFFRVYSRAGEPCLLCHTPIRRISLGGRGTFFCPQCQKLF